MFEEFRKRKARGLLGVEDMVSKDRELSIDIEKY